MAKKKKSLVRLVSTAGTGYFYVAHVSGKKSEKMVFNKYDPRARRHVEFKEAKMK